MIRSLYSGVSGMKSHQIRMDVVGNNISNVNTTGYKSGTVNFQDTLSQTIRSGGDGRNPSQVGTGISVGSVTNDFGQGSLQNTGRTLDLAIDGRGLFVVSDGNETFYTRNGALFIDKEGYLVNSDGLKVQSTKGDIRIYNGPVSDLQIGPNGSISGTNTNGEPLQFSSDPVIIPDPTQAVEAELNGDPMQITPAVVGDAITPATPPEEAAVKGDCNSDSVEPKLATTESVDLTTGYNFEIDYDDGTGSPTTVNLIAGLDDVQGWDDLAKQIQNNLDNSSLAGKVKVSYDDSPYGGLVFETTTDPDGVNSDGDPITPEIELTGGDVEKFMGDLTPGQLTDTGKAVQPQDWTGKVFNFDVGNNWQYVELKSDYTGFDYNWNNTGFDEVTSGQDLADKLQTLFNVMAGDDPSTPGTLEAQPSINVAWENDHLVFTSNLDDTETVKLGGDDVTDFIGSADTESNVDWTAKDFSITYNGTTFNFSEHEKQQAGLDSVTSGDALATAMNKLIDEKIGSDKVDVTWSSDHLVFETKDTTGLGTVPSIAINGTDAADFVGAETSATGTASTQEPPQSQEPNNAIRLVTFSNLEGLAKVGNNLYAQTESSGIPSNDTESTVESNYLEMSNVDLTEQFTDMITTQRGYQAGSRMVTVSDSMLEELINLKR